MGNQLAAAAIVNLKDISSALELVAPLSANDRNYFSTLHCLLQSETDFPQLRVRDAYYSFQPADGHCVSGLGNVHRVSRHANTYAEGDSLGVPEVLVQGDCSTAFNDNLRQHHSTYVQLYLRRDAKEGAVESAHGHSAARRVPIGVGATTPGLSPMIANPGFKRTVIDGATGRSSFQTQDIVAKVFVRSAGDTAQKRFIQLLHEQMQKLLRNIAVVDTTLGSQHPVNVLSYTSVDASDDRFCMLQRPYIAYSLPERLATRPYLSLMDRLFTCFQLLQALLKLHEVYGITHGDIKANNVLLQSTGWLLLADLSPFKPNRVPANNPALFEYYYDGDDTRVCCVAPEKFTDEELPLPPPDYRSRRDATYNESNLNFTGHTSAMDMFSAGCVMGQILTDEPLFRLSEVLELRSLSTPTALETKVYRVLHDRGVPTVAIPLLVRIVGSLPDQRPSAREALEAFTPSVFSPHFHFLYHQVLPPLLCSPPDIQLQLLWAGMDGILKQCNVCALATSLGRASAEKVSDVLEGEADEGLEASRLHTVAALLPVLHQAIGRAATWDAVYRGTAVLRRCLPCCSVQMLLDVVLPWILYVINNPVSYPVTARVIAIRVLRDICDKAVPALSSQLCDDAAQMGDGIVTLFDDLIFPCVTNVLYQAEGEDLAVLAELAAHLPSLLLHAQRCLNHRLDLVGLASSSGGPVAPEVHGLQYDTLIASGWEMVQVLYNHHSTSVVVTMVRGTVDVAVFLGERQTQEDLIPLLTTLMASPIEVLRELFPQAILCHLHHRRPSVSTMGFFLTEGLWQSDVTILMSTLESVATVVCARTLSSTDAMTLVHQSLPLVMNPFECVRRAASRVVEAAVKTYRGSDVMAYLCGAIRPLLSHSVPLMCLSSFPFVLRREMISTTFEASYVNSATQPVCSVLYGARQSGPASERSGWSPGLLWIPAGTVTTARDFVWSSLSVIDASANERKWYTALTSLPQDGREVPWELCYLPTAREAERLRREITVSPATSMSRSFPSPDTASMRIITQDRCAVLTVPDEDSSGPHHVSDSAQLSLGTPTIGKTTSCYRYTHSKSVRRAPITSSNVYTSDAMGLNPIAAAFTTHAVHMGGIYSSTPLSRGLLFTAGARGDGILWTLSSNGLRFVERAPLAASPLSTYLVVRVVREGSDPVIALGSTDGSLRWLNVGKNLVIQEAELDGSAIIAVVAQNDNVLLASTARGNLCGLDTRSPSSAYRPAWKVSMDPLLGAPSCLTACVPERDSCGVVATTFGGYVCLYDLRFQLCVRQYDLAQSRQDGGCERQQLDPLHSFHNLETLPQEKVSCNPFAVLSVCPDPLYHLRLNPSPNGIHNAQVNGPSLLLGVAGGTVYRLHLSTGALSTALQQAGCSPVRAMVTQPSRGLVYSAGDDALVRCWSLRCPRESRTMYCHPNISPEYEERAGPDGGSAGIYEVFSAPDSHAVSGRCASALPPLCHHSDSILTLCVAEERDGGQPYLVSGSRDGTLTTWLNEPMA